MPSNVISTNCTTVLNDLFKSPTRVNNEMMIIASTNLSPKTKLSIIINRTGKAKRIFSPTTIVGRLNKIDNPKKTRIFICVKSSVLNESIINELNVIA